MQTRVATRAIVGLYIFRIAVVSNGIAVGMIHRGHDKLCHFEHGHVRMIAEHGLSINAVRCGIVVSWTTFALGGV